MPIAPSHCESGEKGACGADAGPEYQGGCGCTSNCDPETAPRSPVQIHLLVGGVSVLGVRAVR